MSIRYMFFLRGIFNLTYLVISLKILDYFKTEKRIIQSLSNFKDSKILLISGGPTLYDNLHFLEDYSYIALNSYNTYEKLPKNVKEKIKNRIIFYYQAPFHHPLVLERYQNSINDVVLNINRNAVNVYNLTGKISCYEQRPNNYEFRVVSNLIFFGKHVQASSGVLTMISFLELAGYTNIDLLGADFDWIPSADAKSSKELVEKVESMLSFYKHWFKYMEELRKKGVIVKHLKKNALPNLN